MRWLLTCYFSYLLLFDPDGSKITTMATVEITRAIGIPTGPFRNEPFTDFSQADNARRMREALAQVRSELGREYPMVIGNRLVKTEKKVNSVNPARPSQVVGVV